MSKKQKKGNDLKWDIWNKNTSIFVLLVLYRVVHQFWTFCNNNIGPEFVGNPVDLLALGSK